MSELTKHPNFKDRHNKTRQIQNSSMKNDETERVNGTPSCKRRDEHVPLEQIQLPPEPKLKRDLDPKRTPSSYAVTSKSTERTLVSSNYHSHSSKHAPQQTSHHR